MCSVHTCMIVYKVTLNMVLSVLSIKSYELDEN